MMKKISSIVIASTLSMFAFTVEAAPVSLDLINCDLPIKVTDVTGNISGASDCFGTFDGNDPGPSGDGFILDGTTYNFVAKDDADTGLSGADIGLIVGDNGTFSGTWSYDSSKFAPTEFLIVLKSASNPGYAVWLFEGADAASDAGTWLVAWTNSNDVPHALSHLAIYAPEVPVPAAVWLFGTGLLGLVGVARRRTA